MRRSVVLVTALAVLALSLPAAAGAKVTSTKVRVEAGPRTLIDNAPAQSPGQPLTPGDIQVFTNHMFTGDRRLGTAYGVCFTIVHPISHCSVTATLPRGTLALTGLYDATPDVVGRSSIVGGTGAYRRARGEVVGKGTRATLTIIR